MIRNIKNFMLGIAAALTLAAGPATATTYAVNVGTPLVVGAGASFTDHFNFTLDDTSPSWLLSGAATSVAMFLEFPAPFQDITIDPATFTGIKLFQGTYGVSGATPIWDSMALNTSTASHTWTLLAGSYFVEITGTHPGPYSGTYAVALQAAPVPEPEQWAMMLAGLGMVVAIARRRKTIA